MRNGMIYDITFWVSRLSTTNTWLLSFGAIFIATLLILPKKHSTCWINWIPLHRFYFNLHYISYFPYTNHTFESQTKLYRVDMRLEEFMIPSGMYIELFIVLIGFYLLYNVRWVNINANYKKYHFCYIVHTKRSIERRYTVCLVWIMHSGKF